MTGIWIDSKLNVPSTILPSINQHLFRINWNTSKINDIIQSLRQQGEDIDDETLSHISLLPFRHVLPNGTYFIDDL
jgi:biotin synthase-related radical SAM superfamily protein